MDLGAGVWEQSRLFVSRPWTGFSMFEYAVKILSENCAILSHMLLCYCRNRTQKETSGNFNKSVLLLVAASVFL